MQVKRPSIDGLVFDSGLGGLSILSALRQTLPQFSYAYLADNAALPYGSKPEDWLSERVSLVIERAMQEVDPALLVIACNTASTLVLPQLRARWQIPIVGVVPAIKPASSLSRSRVIGLLATPATIQRSYTDTLIREYGQNCEVVRVGSSELVNLAEAKLRGEKIDLEQIARICAPLQRPDLDVLVLGCTHFPLLSSELEAVLPNVKLVDSGEAIARRVRYLLDASGRSPGASSLTFPAFFTAAENGGIEAVLRDFGLDRLVSLDLPLAASPPLFLPSESVSWVASRV